MQEIGKFNLKVNVIPNRLEKYMSFTINERFSFIDRLVKKSNKDDFRYLSQDLV